MGWKVSFRVFKIVEHCGKVRDKAHNLTLISDDTSRNCSVSSDLIDRFYLSLNSSYVRLELN